MLTASVHPAIIWDPLLCQVTFPYRRTYFPLGFPLELITNSPLVLDAAGESWSMKTAQHRATPVQLRLGVQEGSGETQQELTIPTCRGYAHLVAMVADAENHVTCDLQSGMAFGWVTEAAAAQRGHLRYHFLEAAALILLVAKYLTPIHAACVSLGDSGVLLCGDSGAGKSSLSFACAQRGWTYVTDDGSYLVRDSHDRTVVANPHVIRFRSSAKSLFPELGDQDITRRLNGEFGIELRTQEIPGLRISSQPRIDHVVMLRRRSGAAPSITKMDPAELRAWLEQVVCYGDEQVCAEQRDSFERLLTANLCEFEYSDLDAAVSRLRSLIEQGR